MISYHVEHPDYSHPSIYTSGFKSADTNDIERLKKGIIGCVWSPILWKDGYRKQDNFLRADWCVLDFDDGAMTLEEACQIFCDRIHIIGTTKNHQKLKGNFVCDRFRVLLRFNEPITELSIYRWNMVKMMKNYPVDKSCKDGARFFFPCTDIVQSSADGYIEDVDENIPDNFEAPPDFKKYNNVVPPWVRNMLETVIPIGQRSNIVFRIAKDLARYGIDESAIMGFILRSETYRNGIDDQSMKKVREAVSSGLRSARKSAS